MTAIEVEPLLELQDADLELFSAASLDRNPLHLSDAYARQTAYGKRVAFGSLAVLACMGRLPPRRNGGLTRLTVDFKKPVFVGIPYRIEADATGEDAITLRLLDGSQLLFKAILRFGGASGAPTAPVPVVGAQTVARQEAADLVLADIVPGREIGGSYCPPASQIRALFDRLALPDRGIGDFALTSLLACSYLIGMELPGSRALFSRLDLTFDRTGAPAQAQSPLTFHLKVAQVDPRFELVTLAVGLQSGTESAVGQLRSFCRSEAPATSRSRIEALLHAADGLRDKTALVIGGSRGLGASMALALATRGCRVLVGFQKSSEAARRLQASSVGVTGSIHLVPLDAGAPAACLEARRMILDSGGRLDFLICNASPPLLPLPLEPASAARISAFVATAIAQVSVPIATFLDLLATGKGVGVVISSAALKDPPAEWPHYVAAKAAIEMLAKVASQSVPFIAVRPPSLLTEMTNTPVGRANAISPDIVAVRLVRRLEQTRPQGLEILEDFHPTAEL
jgi:NAD(P)-dependent dehydrogenase (short-subunit alcohol dehydrogenase family)